MAKYDHDDKNLAHRLTSEESAEVIKGMLEHDFDYQQTLLKSDYFIDCTPPVYNENEPMCGVGINNACMVANGNVYPCAGWQGYVCGNLYKTSLKDIWENSSQMNFLRNIRKKDFPKCKTCVDRKFCHPCMARISNENKDGSPFRLVPHFCQSAHINRIVVENWVKELRENNKKIKNVVLNG